MKDLLLFDPREEGSVEIPLFFVPRRDENAGMILTMSGLSAGVDAHTIARLTSIADQYAVGAPYQVVS